ncbi:MAG TPA: Sec-independent protein translocase protein TatB [Actinomycetota bacterium]|nr:Sec-independent protein translocase protein TatB [Actinomycetota bacterium]
MPQIGPLEILVVGVIALIVFGPNRLPDIARSVGKALNEFKRQANDIKSEFREGLDVQGLDGVEDEDPVSAQGPSAEPLPEPPPGTPLEPGSPGVDASDPASPPSEG